MTSVVYNKAFQNLQTFVEHNQDISPSLYRLDVAEERLTSFQTCGLMRLVELICTYIADAFRSLFCCCDCTNTGRSEKQELIRATLRESVRTLNDTIIQGEQLQAFNELAQAFNRITESMRNEETTCCMNGLYNKTGWNLGEDVQNLTLHNPALPRPPAPPPQQNENPDPREIDTSIQKGSTPISGSESTSTQPPIVEEICDEDELIEESQPEASTQTTQPLPAPPVPLPKSTAPKNPPVATSKQPPSTARHTNLSGAINPSPLLTRDEGRSLTEEEQLRIVLEQSALEAQMPTVSSSKAAHLSNRNITRIDATRQPPLGSLNEDEQLRLAIEQSRTTNSRTEPTEEEQIELAKLLSTLTPEAVTVLNQEEDPELAEACRLSLAENAPIDESPKIEEAPKITATDVPEVATNNVYLPFNSENINSILTATITEEYIDQLKTTVQRMDVFAYNDGKMNSYLDADQNLMDLSLASGVELPNHEKILNDFYECFKTSKNPYPSIREARGLVWARIVRPILEAYEMLRQDKSKDVDKTIADKRASALTAGHRNQFINKYVGLIEDIFLAAGKEILKNEFKGEPLSETTQGIKDLMIYMINDAGNDLKRVSSLQEADTADTAPKDVDLDAKTHSFIILGQLPKSK
jgi:hypothetical protein